MIAANDIIKTRSTSKYRSSAIRECRPIMYKLRTS